MIYCFCNVSIVKGPQEPFYREQLLLKVRIMFFCVIFFFLVIVCIYLTTRKKGKGKKLGLLKSSCEVTVINEEEFHLQLYFL